MGYLPASLCQHLLPHPTLNNYLASLHTEGLLSEDDFIQILCAFIQYELYEDVLEKLVSKRHICNHYLLEMNGAMLPSVGGALQLLELEGTLTVSDVEYLRILLITKNVAHVLNLQMMI